MDVVLTFGILPTQGQFDSQWGKEDEKGGFAQDGKFHFGQDRRVGTCELSQGELWEELQKAVAEHEVGSEEAGDWCSAVLGCLSIEWV